MTSKQRAYLKGLAMTMEPIAQIGKASLTEEGLAGLEQALEARELIKIAVLKNCDDDVRSIAEAQNICTRMWCRSSVAASYCTVLPDRQKNAGSSCRVRERIGNEEDRYIGWDL